MGVNPVTLSDYAVRDCVCGGYLQTEMCGRFWLRTSKPLTAPSRFLWILYKKTLEVLSLLRALSQLDDLASVCPTYENLANTLEYAGIR